MLRLLFVGILASIYIIHIQADKSVNDLIFDKLTQLKTSESDALQDLLNVLDDNRSALALWNIYKTYQKKTYQTPEEDRERMKKFIVNLRLILTANDEYKRGIRSFPLEMNVFGDMDKKEFLDKYTGLKRVTNYQHNSATTVRPDLGAGEEETTTSGPVFDYREIHESEKDTSNRDNSTYTRAKRSLTVPDHLDYRPLLRPVENQQGCRSCYAFGVAGTIEGAYAVQKKQLIRLSKQQIVDCGPNDGCGGGWPGEQYEYVKKSGGLQLDTVYPYHAVQGVCSAKQSAPGRIRGYGKITSEDEDDMKVHLLIYGPLTITIDADGFQFLARAPKTIIDAPNCGKLNHVVIIVGYGTRDGQDYWLVRNSWGRDWADFGYFKLARNRNGMCGLTKDVHYVLV